MDHFAYHDGVLCAESVPMPVIAETYGTPVYCMARATLERHYRVLEAALKGLDCRIFFAPKANASLAVLRSLALLGSGADVVSEGECRLAMAAGIPPSRIAFSGVGKTRAELEYAVAQGVGLINVESSTELDLLDAVGRFQGKRAEAALRVNPDVDSGGESKIATGRAGDKFGVAYGDVAGLYRHGAALEGVRMIGLDMHIGSQVPSLEPFETAFERLRGLARRLAGEGLDMEVIDIGGGVGAHYEEDGKTPSPADYGALVRRVFGDFEGRIVVEPGRMIAANAGVLLARALYVKQAGSRSILVLDAGMNDLIRPSLYGAWHAIDPVKEPAPDCERSMYDVVGPVCETGDTFARDRSLPPVVAGDLVVFRGAGAYGASMASEYNSRPRVAEVMVSKDRHAMTRARPTYAEMISRERVPDWLEDCP